MSFPIVRMKILHISDTHGCHRSLTDLPEVDIIVHSGDFTMNGTEEEAIDFLNWFCDLPHLHKIFIGGNHDACFYEASIDGLDSNCHYLCNSSVVIEGIKFYGIPLFMPDCVNGRQKRYYSSIPIDTDVLITHAPPYGILDLEDGHHFGSEDLLLSVLELSPKLQLFGHIHDGTGWCRQHDTVFSNGSVWKDKYDMGTYTYHVFEI